MQEERLRMHLRGGLAEGLGVGTEGREAQKLQPRLQYTEVTATGEKRDWPPLGWGQ